MASDKSNGKMLKCRMCGKEYRSRGINDPGYCKECERNIKAAQNTQLGGPLFGRKIGGS